jgi:hypothetical protein
MAKFSAADAAMEGFKVIGRRPASFAVWVLVWVLLGVAPGLMFMGPMASKIADFASQAQAMQGDAAADPTAMAHKALDMEMGLFAVAWPYMIWSLLLGVLLLAALYRSILEPDKRGFAYLRIGADELRLLATMIILCILFVVFYSVLFALTGVLVAFTERGVGGGWGGLLIALEVIVAICVALYVPFKLSLAMPATFAEKKIRIFESWGLTRDHFWHIVGMWLLTLVFLIVVAVIGGVVVRIAGMGTLAGTGGIGSLHDFVRSVKSGGSAAATAGLPDLLHAIGPALIVAALLQGIVQVVSRTVLHAPFAAAYAALSGRAG